MSRIDIKLLMGLLLFVLVSCTKEPPPTTTEQPIPVVVRAAVMASKSASDDDIETLRLVVFRIADGALIYNKKQAGSQPFVFQTLSGQVRMVMVANELLAWNLDNVRTPADFETKVFDKETVSTLAPPLTMYANVVNMISATTRQFSIELERTHAKVTVNITCNFATVGKSIKLYSLGVEILPVESYLVAKTYNGSLGYFYSANRTVDGSAGNVIYSANGLTTKPGGIVFYVPEKKVTNTLNHTYLRLAARTNEKPDNIFSYRIVLGDGMGRLCGSNPVAFSSLTPADLCLTRNSHYIVSITINTLNPTPILAVQSMVAQQ
ncbi:MAG: hypothetical protein RR005_00975 [Mucinivorans sp.]